MSATEPQFRGYVCWDSHHVGDTIKTDAASPSPPTLLAVHHPGHISEARDGRPVPDRRVTEADVLEALLNPTETLTLVPIIGDSGTGKSHLVRWLRARIEEGPRRRVVYLPRSGTGLRGLIELLLVQLGTEDDVPEVRQLREELARAFGTANEDQVPARLLDAMARQLEAISTEPAEGKAGRRRRGLASALPALIHDYALRPYWLREGGVIQRYVEQATQGPPDDDTGEGFAFGAADLPDDRDVGEVADLGQLAKDALRSLQSSPEMGEEAALLASEALSRAVPEVFGLSGEVTLSDVFRRARALLLARNEELVILIEDLTKLQGVDRELVNVLLDPVEESGTQVLCDLRVAVAVTTGYYRSLDETFKTRAESSGTTFILDAPFDGSAESWTSDELIDFASRYLNATRLGAEALEVAHAAASSAEIKAGTWIPDGCHGCVYQATCHEGFGDVGGRGLYPFNRAALQTMADAVLVGDFNPRKILKLVLFPVLAHHADELAAGRFPSRALERAFPDAAALSGPAQTGASAYPDRDRREVLLRFWAGNPSEVVDLLPAVHEAFALPSTGSAMVEVVTPPASPKAAPSAGTTEPVKEVPLPDREPSGVEEWANGKSMPRVDVNRMQTALYEGVLRLIPWSQLGIRTNHPYFVGSADGKSGLLLGRRSFHIEDGLGVDPAQTEVTSRLDRETHRDLLLYVDQAGDRGGIGLGFAGYHIVQSFLEEVADRVEAAIRARVDPSDDDAPLTVLTEWLELGALVLGDDDGASRGAARDGASDPVVAAGQVLKATRRPPSDQATPWARLGADLSEARTEVVGALLSLAEYRQGNAPKPGIFRAGRIARALRVADGTWTVGRKLPPLPDALDSRLSSISTRELKGAASGEFERVEAACVDLRAMLGEPPWDGVAVADALVAALTAAEQIDAFPGSPPDVRQTLEVVRHLPLTVLGELAAAPLDSTAPIEALLARISSLQRVGLTEVHRMIEYLDQAYRDATETVTERLENAGGGGAGSALDATTREVEDLVRALESLS